MKNIFLYLCYNISLGILVVIVTFFTWPIIILFQQFDLTRKWYYSYIFSIICRLFNGTVVQPKEKLFDLMNKHLEELVKTKDMIRVLEIGPGTGDNFKYYKIPIKLTTIDLNPFLEKTAYELSVKYPLVKVIDNRVANAENMYCFEDNTFDIVLGTLIMCCINDNDAALSEIRRVLRPNGRYYFLEGNKLQESRSLTMQLTQSFFAFFWILCEYGCKFFRNNFDEKLKASKMLLSVHCIYCIRETGLGHELHYGCAVKI